MKFHTRLAVCLFCCLAPFSLSLAQKEPADTSRTLQEVKIKAYLTEQALFTLPVSLGKVDSLALQQNLGSTLLPAINSIPGVRMEERSPGSYRLSVRGSLLRSPFGVRNIKIYFDEIPLTDAGGNTYFNSLDPEGLGGLAILKGPDGSLFGANSGGVVLVRPNGTGAFYNEVSAKLSAGSYGLFHEQVKLNRQVSENYRFSINQAFQQADGYRQNSAMKRLYFQTVHRWNYTPNNEVRLLAFYSDLDYRTPGGLTEGQFMEDPSHARPAGGPNPGAVEQHAGIINKTLFGGLVHEANLSNRLKHVVSIFGTHTDFTNPFITNYEIRNENNFGFRTYLNLAGNVESNFPWLLSGGMEWQKGTADIYNYDNNEGVKGEQQAADALRNGTYFYFARFSGNWKQRLYVEAASSINYYQYAFHGIFPQADEGYSTIKFNPQWMPRLAFSYVIRPDLSWRASVARGYSPPTTAEVRSSDKIINTALQAETGWNYETGLRWQNERIQVDASVFYYRMQDAIIRQLRDDGAEYFSNSGGVNQRGMEAAINAVLIPARNAGFIRSLQLTSNVTISDFKFGHYEVGEDNFSGNKLTGVPANVIVSGISIDFPKRFGLYVSHNYTSTIPLNDGNTVFASDYHLVQAKARWNTKVNGKAGVEVFAGVDNLLNENYSLGNDINAYGGRFFNAAPLRNYVAGIALRVY